jgi:hypothetical protein
MADLRERTVNEQSAGVTGSTKANPPAEPARQTDDRQDQSCVR